MNGRFFLAALCCLAPQVTANASPQDPRLRHMMRTADMAEIGEGVKGASVRVSYYCSKDTAQEIGVTVLSVQGVSLKLFDFDGNLVAEDSDQQRAINRRSDILNYKKVDMAFGQVPDGDYYVAFCDIDQHQACNIPEDRRRDPLDEDDGEDSIAVVGHVDSVTIQQGFARDVGQARVLFDLPRRQQWDDDREGYPPKGERGECDDVDSPLIIDLGDDGIALSGLANGVAFDLDAQGVKDLVAWPVSADDAFLAYDKNHNGLIDDGNELFGNHYIGPDGFKSGNGFLSLGKYDENRDGKIDQADAIFKDLVVWGDANRNGVSEAGELMTLSRAGIVDISLSYVERVEKDVYGNEIRQRSIAKVGDGVRVVVDAWLRRL